MAGFVGFIFISSGCGRSVVPSVNNRRYHPAPSPPSPFVSWRTTSPSRAFPLPCPPIYTPSSSLTCRTTSPSVIFATRIAGAAQPAFTPFTPPPFPLHPLPPPLPPFLPSPSLTLAPPPGSTDDEVGGGEEGGGEEGGETDHAKG
ncbi:hypothetical protein B0H12DRAFT_1228996 [Mycena haematopus]|nr:hypothetical protein B0H12DRAFT_1228996 [Mycena haematopus]